MGPATASSGLELLTGSSCKQGSTGRLGCATEHGSAGEMQTKHLGSASPQKADFWACLGVLPSQQDGSQGPKALTAPVSSKTASGALDPDPQKNWAPGHRCYPSLITAVCPAPGSYESQLLPSTFTTFQTHSWSDTGLRARAVQITKGKRRHATSVLKTRYLALMYNNRSPSHAKLRWPGEVSAEAEPLD